MISDVSTAYIVYDGDCPFCSRYVRLVRLREAVGKVELIDARTPHPVVDWLRGQNFNLDEGMAFVQDGQVFFGDECIQRMALLSTPSGLLNGFNAWVFRSPRRARLFYPYLRAIRNGTLLLLGRSRLGLGP